MRHIASDSMGGLMVGGCECSYSFPPVLSMRGAVQILVEHFAVEKLVELIRKEGGR